MGEGKGMLGQGRHALQRPRTQEELRCMSFGGDTPALARGASAREASGCASTPRSASVYTNMHSSRKRLPVPSVGIDWACFQGAGACLPTHAPYTYTQPSKSKREQRNTHSDFIEQQL
jgi:hypothetical protein